MPGTTDLVQMLRTLSATPRPGRFTMVSLDAHHMAPSITEPGIEMVLTEAEGTTVIATVDAARQRGWPFDFVAGWLTLDVHSALEAVGLTAAVAQAFTDVDISCNVVAGFFHDHLLVPIDRVDDALAALESLRS